MTKNCETRLIVRQALLWAITIVGGLLGSIVAEPIAAELIVAESIAAEPLAVGAAEAGSVGLDMAERLKKSLVRLQVAAYDYDLHRPWKHTDIAQGAKYGCAVGQYEVLTTASGMAHVTLIKARRYGQNEFIPAKIKVVDYQNHLCLIELDREAMDEPLTGLTFSDDYKKGDKVDSFWLTGGDYVYSGRGFLDRAQMAKSPHSFALMLNYIVKNTSERTGSAELYCLGGKPIGLAGWANNEDTAGVIPARVINNFLADVADGSYEGLPVVGFDSEELLDPARRTYLQMPDSLRHGVYVRKVHTLGSGSDVLEAGDVLLAIDGAQLDSHGQFRHPVFERLSFEYLIADKAVGESAMFDVWRDGKEQRLEVKTRNFQAGDMLVPYHQFERQPEYIVTAGFVIQKLTRPYLRLWGKSWSGRVSPHLYHYYRDLAFEPNDRRHDIVILSYVLPADINLGYRNLRQLVVAKVNGRDITCLGDVLEAQRLDPDARFDIIELENANPIIVIPRDQLKEADQAIARNYGIAELVHVEQ